MKLKDEMRIDGMTQTYNPHCSRFIPKFHFIRNFFIPASFASFAAFRALAFLHSILIKIEFSKAAPAALAH